MVPQLETQQTMTLDSSRASIEGPSNADPIQSGATELEQLKMMVLAERIERLSSEIRCLNVEVQMKAQEIRGLQAQGMGMRAEIAKRLGIDDPIRRQAGL